MPKDNGSDPNRKRRFPRLFKQEEGIEAQIEDLLPEEDDQLGKAYDSGLVRRLAGYLQPYTGRLILAIILMIISSLLAVSQPLIIGKAIDDGIRTGSISDNAYLVDRFFDSGHWCLDNQSLAYRDHGLCRNQCGCRFSQPSFPPSAYTFAELLQ